MKNKYYLLALLSVLLLASCKSKKAVVASPKPPIVTIVDTVSPNPPVKVRTETEQPPQKVADVPVKEVQKENVVIPEVTVEQKTAVTPVERTAPAAKIDYSVKKIAESSNDGIEQIAQYNFTHPDVPKAFDGFRIAFISDLHYKSLLGEKGLNTLVNLLIAQKPDVLLMGGDYQEGCEFVEPLFAALSKVKTPMGTFGVLGNNDYERCHDDIIRTMQKYGMHVLEQKVDTLRKNGQQIILAGVRNPFDLATNGKSPTLALSPKDFVVLLVHTPDYIEDVSVANTDLALAGHTHGGQVRIFGVAPIKNSHFGDRFLTGLVRNSAKIPMIVTNGIGTSQMPIRLGAPSEIVMITLHHSLE